MLRKGSRQVRRRWTGWSLPSRDQLSHQVRITGKTECRAASASRTWRDASCVLRSQEDELRDLRRAATQAPEISKVYNHYRGENLPDTKFFNNALVETFSIPQDKLGEFTGVFSETLEYARLLEKHDNKTRVLDVS